MIIKKSTIVKDDHLVEIPEGAVAVKMYHDFNMDTQKIEYVLVFMIPEETDAS